MLPSLSGDCVPYPQLEIALCHGDFKVIKLMKEYKMFGSQVNNKCLPVSIVKAGSKPKLGKIVILRRMLKKESVRLRLNVDGLEQTQQRAGVNMKTALSNFLTAEEFLD